MTSQVPRVRTVALAIGMLVVLSACSQTVAGHPVAGGAPRSTERVEPTTPTDPPGTEDEEPADPTTPAQEPLVPEAIDRVFQVYMNGLANHDMTALQSGTCPRLRPTLAGFALHGYYVDSWTMLPYEVPSGMEYVVVQATVMQRDPNSGGLAGEVLYSWYVERDPDQNYYVCGWLEYQGLHSS